MRSSRRNRVLSGALVQLLAVGSWLLASQLPASAHAWVIGDTFVAISNGQYQQFDVNGTTGDLLQAGVTDNPEAPDGKFTAECATNPTLGVTGAAQNLYTTLWSENKIAVVPDGAHTPIVTIDTTAGTGTTGHPETIAFNSVGDFYVGLVDAAPQTPNLLKYSRNHTLLGTWVVPTGVRGVDHLDVAANQTTIYYTSEDGIIRTWDITSTGVGTGTGTAGTFATVNGSRFYGLRLLQGGNPFGGGNGTGYLMVADTTNIKVFNTAGSVINTYGANVPLNQSTYGAGWFSVSVANGGQQFVAGDFYSGRVVRFNADGSPASNFVANGQAFRVNGVCVRGEVTTGVVPFPSIGFFLVGDKSAGYPNFTGLPNGNNVYFWGSNWSTSNQVSGTNGASNAFKGFAEATNPATPTCGDTFTSGGGNSVSPPASLPPRVAVLVTTNITSGGSVKGQGTIKAIVIVDVTQGSYNGAPGGSGTGRIIQVICKI